MEAEPRRRTAPTTTPREARIRRGIVSFSAIQILLGAVIIAFSFTAFACSSSEKIRSACPYWAGFTVLFTGSVGFLTWRQLSIISIGIYTFLSAVSVIIHLVATVLTVDSGGFLNSLIGCRKIVFEHSCECCIVNSSCKTPYKFLNVRDCSTLHGFLKNTMYVLCAINVICCIICLIVTVVGCTLIAQYSRYSQTFVFRWSRRHVPPLPHDHRYTWSPYPSSPGNHIPPCAPPIYFPVERDVGASEPQYRRPPTIFDLADFPPPYSSREPSLSGQQGSRVFQDPLEYLEPEGSSWDQNTVVHVEFGPYGHPAGSYETSLGNTDDIFDQVSDGGREPGSTSEGVSDLPDEEEDSLGICRAHVDNVGHDVYLQLPQPVDEMHSQVSTDSDAYLDDVFDCSGTFSFDGGAQYAGSGTSQPDVPSEQQSQHCVGQRRHSCPQHGLVTQSNQDCSAQVEIYRLVVPPNVNPWARSRTFSAHETLGPGARHNSEQLNRRSNSTPCYAAAPTDRGLVSHRNRHPPSRDPSEVVTREESPREECPAAELSVDNTPGSPRTSEDQSMTASRRANDGLSEIGDLFSHFKESRGTRSRRRKRNKRPRNNPGHILERETDAPKKFSAREGETGTESCDTTTPADCQETHML